MDKWREIIIAIARGKHDWDASLSRR